MGIDTYEARRISFPFQFRDRIVILENAPAFVCQQCGERLLPPSTALAIEEIGRAEHRPVRTEEIPVYDLGTVTQDITAA